MSAVLALTLITKIQQIIIYATTNLTYLAIEGYLIFQLFN